MNRLLAQSIPFDPADPAGSLAELPEAAGVFALYAAEPAAEPYLSKTPNLRRRLQRFLRGSHPPVPGEDGEAAPEAVPKTRRLQLAHRVHHIEYSVTGSEFESSLCLYQASLGAFGERTRKRLRLRPPAFLRMSVENAYPRVYPTTKVTRSAAPALFGPFASRAAAERYGEEMLDLFLLRRCVEDLHPDPSFPGCPYSEMKKCLAPCFQGCSGARYQQEAQEVRAFLETRGASLEEKLEAERNAASEFLEFERAAALHQKMQKVQAVMQLGGEAIRPLNALNGMIVQPGAIAGEIALFRLQAGYLSGPAPYSTLGMRLANERSGSTSLFAQPVALEPAPLDDGSSKTGGTTVSGTTTSEQTLPQAKKDILESRLEEALTSLDSRSAKLPSVQTLSDHLALFTRWFYRPVARRIGEAVFCGRDGKLNRKAVLRAVSRVAARSLVNDPGKMDPTQVDPSKMEHRKEEGIEAPAGPGH